MIAQHLCNLTAARYIRELYEPQLPGSRSNVMQRRDPNIMTITKDPMNDKRFMTYGTEVVRCTTATEGSKL